MLVAKIEGRMARKPKNLLEQMEVKLASSVLETA